MRHPLYEDWLDRQNVSYQFVPDVPFTRIDGARSLGNQARLERALDQGTVSSYAQAMLDGAKFPALIAYQLDPANERLGPDGADLILITGNHRQAAASEVGERAFDVYVVTESSPIVRERLTRTANFIEGRRPPTDEAVLHAIWLVQRDGYTSSAAARLTNLRADYLDRVLRAERVKSRLIGLGVKATNVPQGQLSTLNVLKTDPVLRAGGAAAVNYRLTIEQVQEMTRRATTRVTEAEQILEISQYVREAHIAARPALTGKNGQFTRMSSPVMRLLGGLGMMKKHLERHVTPTDSGILDPAEFQHVLDEWAILQTLFGNWASKGRKVYGRGSSENALADHGTQEHARVNDRPVGVN